jgi:hypothetical protein
MPQSHPRFATNAENHLSRDQDPAAGPSDSALPLAEQHFILPNPNVPNVAQRAATLDSCPRSYSPKKNPHQHQRQRISIGATTIQLSCGRSRQLRSTATRPVDS